MSIRRYVSYISAQSWSVFHMEVHCPKPIRTFAIIHKRWFQWGASDLITSNYVSCVKFHNALMKQRRKHAQQKIQRVTCVPVPLAIWNVIRVQYNIIRPLNVPDANFADLITILSDYAESHNEPKFEKFQ